MKTTPIIAAGITLVTLATWTPLSQAQTTLRRSVIGAGGGTVSTGTTSITFTIGQPIVGQYSGFTNTINAGFWTPGTRRCPADFDDGSGTGTPDGGVTIDDLLYYLSIFEAGDVRADVDDGSGTGTLDGGVTIDDLLYFLERFEAGC